MIRMQQVCKSFERPEGGRLPVLCDVDLDIEAGEFVAVVGPSGTGKTTLMNILGLLDRPTSGSYTLQGDEVADLSSDALARLRNQRIGFVFQQFHLLPRTTAIENVELPLVYADVDDPRERAVEALRRVGLGDRLQHAPSELSGGQQQRVAIARALVNEPDLILADEPTGNLDQATGQRLMDLFAELHAGGKTLVLITHDLELAHRASRILRIEDGRLADASLRPVPPPSEAKALASGGVS